MKIPSFVLRKLYVKGSLQAHADGLRFVLRNTLATATLTGLRALHVNGAAVDPATLQVAVDGKALNATDVRNDQPLEFRRNAEAEIRIRGPAPAGALKVRVEVLSAEFGELVIDFEDVVAPRA